MGKDTKREGSHTYSILTGKDKRCFVSGRREGLNKHHIYHGTGLRKISDRYGFWCYLWEPLHLAGLGGLHAHPNSGLDLQLKQMCQRKFEETHSREEFMAIIGRNYLHSDYAAEGGYVPDDEAGEGFYLLDTSRMIDERWEEE